MNADLIINSTKNLMAYSGKVVKVIPKLESVKLTFNLNPKKGCGQVVKEV